MTRTPLVPVLTMLPLLFCAACEQQGVNPPTEPANPIAVSDADAPPATRPPDVGVVMQGSGPATFVGRWAAQASWCASTQGAKQPITISTMRFEGYENSCAIASLDQVSDGYEAALACQAEGTPSTERVRLAVQGDALRLTWLNRDNAVVQLVRCPGAPEPTG